MSIQLKPDTPVNLTQLTQPGIKRDGTDFDSPFYQDGQWLRFQRGRPRKIGGYRGMTNLLTGPVRNAFVDSRAGTNTLHTFSPWGVQRLEFDSQGNGGAVVDRTPSGFTRNDLLRWTADRMFSGAGSPYTALMCAATPDIADIASDTGGRLYYGDITATAALAQASDAGGPISVSGGCVVLQPFLFVYGSNGLIRNTIANPDLSVATAWSGTNSNTANVAGTKIIKGLPVRGGSTSPAGLFWALDSLLRVTFVGGTAIWRYDTISTSINVLSGNGIVEYDGNYYWVGTDRFFMYNGVVQELPNQMNFNWFFDNLNIAQRQKVWALKIPKYGEIWWFFPFGSATECTHAICYNVRENTWYDNRNPRTAGTSPQVFPFPIKIGGEEDRDTTYITYTAGVGSFAPGSTVTGGTSGATGTIARVLNTTPPALNLINVSGTFAAAESISAGSVTGTNISSPQAQTLSVAWQHEYGVDKIYGSDVTAIRSFFETTNMSYADGQLSGGQPVDQQVRTTRVEPDFIMVGNMNCYVNGRSYAQQSNTLSQPYTFSSSTPFFNIREQRRLMSLIFESNEQNGNYQLGKMLATLEPGDARG